MSVRSVSVEPVPGVGFQVFTEGREGRKARALFQTAADANAEARSLFDLALAFHGLGASNGKTLPQPELRLAEVPDAA